MSRLKVPDVLSVTTAFVILLVASTQAAVTYSTIHSPIKSGDPGGLDDFISASDCIAGQIGTELEPLYGWHPAITDPLDRAPALTDGIGMRPSGLTGLLMDFPDVGTPAMTIDYDLTGTAANLFGVRDIAIFSSNEEDGRIFSTTVIEYSTDGGLSYETLGYFQSDPSGTTNYAGDPNSIGQMATLVTVVDDLGGALIPVGVTNLTFKLFSTSCATHGQMHDPFAGVNPYTGFDDGLCAASISPLIMELDVNALPEPTGFHLLALAALALVGRRRRRFPQTLLHADAGLRANIPRTAGNPSD